MAYGKTSKKPTANETAKAREERHAMGQFTPRQRSKSPKSPKSPKATPKRGGSRKRSRKRMSYY